MKMVMTIIFFMPFLIVVAQKKECQIGYSYMPTLSTSSLIIVADTCLPDSSCKRLWKEFSKNLCGETGMGFMSLGKETKTFTPTSYDNNHTWNDSTGCIEKEIWKKLFHGKWVQISEQEFNRINEKNK